MRPSGVVFAPRTDVEGAGAVLDSHAATASIFLVERPDPNPGVVEVVVMESSDFDAAELESGPILATVGAIAIWPR
jgi:hypothetical protein